MDGRDVRGAVVVDGGDGRHLGPLEKPPHIVLPHPVVDHPLLHANRMSSDIDKTFLGCDRKYYIPIS